MALVDCTLKLCTLSRNVLLFKRNSFVFPVNFWKQALYSVHRDCATNSVDHEIQEYSTETHESTMDKSRTVPFSIADYLQRKHLKPIQPENPHFLRVAIFGEPNAGKSTLTNALVKWKVCAVSKKVHTTRKKSSSVIVKDNKQIVFLDTPGFITPQQSKKHKVEVSLVIDPEISFLSADLVGVVVDASNKWTNKRIHPEILILLNNCRDKKHILILNKVDAVKKKEDLLSMTRSLTRGIVDGVVSAQRMKQNNGASAQMANKIPKKMSEDDELEEMFQKTEALLANSTGISETSPISLEYFEGSKGWPNFSKVFMVSSLNDEGVDDLRDFLFSSAMPGKWLYHESCVTDKHPHEIALTTVREKLLDCLPKEIPYHLELKIKDWNIDLTGCLVIKIAIQCPKTRYKHLVIGKSGKLIGKCVEESRQSLQDTFRSEILLKLVVE